MSIFKLVIPYVMWFNSLHNSLLNTKAAKYTHNWSQKWKCSNYGIRTYIFLFSVYLTLSTMPKAFRYVITILFFFYSTDFSHAKNALQKFFFRAVITTQYIGNWELNQGRKYKHQTCRHPDVDGLDVRNAGKWRIHSRTLGSDC